MCYHQQVPEIPVDFCSSKVGIFESTFVHFMRKAYLLVSHCQSPLRPGPSTRNSQVRLSSWSQLDPSSTSGYQAIGQSAQKSGAAAVSLEEGVSAGFPVGPHACGLE